MPRKQKQYHFIYKTTCTITQRFYIGLHSTDNLNDSYMGSGKRLWYSIKKYGRNNHKLEILESFTDRESLVKRERELVNEDIIKDEMCMNLMIGGVGSAPGITTVKDKDGNVFRTSINNPRFLNGELVGHTKGKITIQDVNGDYYSVHKNDPRCLNGTVVVRDIYGISRRVLINDPRYIGGELISIWKDRKHSINTIMKMKNTHKLNGHQQGEKNSCYGTCWIYNKEQRLNKKIKKEELDIWVNAGWIKGRKIKSLGEPK